MSRALVLTAAALSLLPWAPFPRPHGALREPGPAGARCAQDPMRPAQDPQACGKCHEAVHGEWRDSAHARAFTDPRYRQALAGRREPERCVPCHAPASVLGRLGQLPRSRQDRRDDGVDCASCHLRGEVVHGPRGTATGAHATVDDPVFARRASTALCRGCHDMRIADVLPLAREFERAASTADESCVGCHMPSQNRPPARDPDGTEVAPARQGRSHRLLGPTDAAFCASAFTFRLAAAPPVGAEKAPGLHAFVGNAAGHGIPGLARGREFAIVLTLRDANGKSLHDHRLVLSGSNRLLVDEERRLALPRPAAAVAMHVRVDHVVDGRTIATIVDKEMELP